MVNKYFDGQVPEYNGTPNEVDEQIEKFSLEQIEKFETLVSLSCLTSLTILVDDAMDALLAQTRVVVDMLRGELAVLLENQLYGK